MRNKARIKPLLNKLQIFWEQHSDLRLGQIIYMLADTLDCNDIFFPEDDKWSDALDKLLKNQNISDATNRIKI
jgi:uncharacterized protein YihD (DUF1040 family)